MDKWDELREYLRQELEIMVTEASEARTYGWRERNLAMARMLTEILALMDRLEANDEQVG